HEQAESAQTIHRHGPPVGFVDAGRRRPGLVLLYRLARQRESRQGSSRTAVPHSSRVARRSVAGSRLFRRAAVAFWPGCLSVLYRARVRAVQPIRADRAESIVGASPGSGRDGSDGPRRVRGMPAERGNPHGGARLGGEPMSLLWPCDRQPLEPEPVVWGGDGGWEESEGVAIPEDPRNDRLVSRVGPRQPRLTRTLPASRAGGR